MGESIQDFIHEFDMESYDMGLINSNYPEAITRLMHKAFGNSVTVDELNRECKQDNTVVLIDESDNVVATSPLSELQDSILMVNSDLYKTGSVEMEDIQVPEVISELTNTRFEARGYPESDKEKLPLILISREIERKAYNSGAGRLRSSFQYLSRIKDEQGTRHAYRKLGESEVDTHVYGLPDWIPTRSGLDVKTHVGTDVVHKKAWFVVHHGENIDDEMALLAFEEEPNQWSSVWTDKSENVSKIARYIEKNL